MTIQTERRVPMAVVVTLVLQTAAALLWAGAAEQRLSHVERELGAHDGEGERIARVEEQVNAVRAQLERIEHKIDAMKGEPHG